MVKVKYRGVTYECMDVLEAIRLIKWLNVMLGHSGVDNERASIGLPAARSGKLWPMRSGDDDGA